VREFDFSGMEIKWGSRYTVTEHEVVEWEGETTVAAASLSRARRRKESVLLCEGGMRQVNEMK